MKLRSTLLLQKIVIYSSLREESTLPASRFLLPSVFLYHVSQLNNEFPLFIFLTRLKGMLIFPSQCCLAAVAEDVRHSVQASQQDSLLRGAAANIDHRVEQIGPALAALEGFADEFVMVGQVGPAVDAGVGPVAGGQILAECLRHLLVLLIRPAWLRAVGWPCAPHARLVCCCATWLVCVRPVLVLRLTRARAVNFSEPGRLGEKAAGDQVTRHYKSST